MVTTSQLNDNVKRALDRIKEKGKETYEDVIVKMMKKIEEDKRGKDELLIEGCKVMAEDSLRIVKEWEATDSQLDWEWEGDEHSKR